MQKYTLALAELLKNDCEITIFKNMSGTFTVRADDGGKKAHGTHGQYRRAIVLCWKDYQNYKGK